MATEKVTIEIEGIEPNRIRINGKTLDKIDLPNPPKPLYEIGDFVRISEDLDFPGGRGKVVGIGGYDNRNDSFIYSVEIIDEPIEPDGRKYVREYYADDIEEIGPPLEEAYYAPGDRVEIGPIDLYGFNGRELHPPKELEGSFVRIVAIIEETPEDDFPYRIYLVRNEGKDTPRVKYEIIEEEIRGKVFTLPPKKEKIDGGP